LVAGALIIALGGVGSRVVHVELAHHQTDRDTAQDFACAHWDSKARLAAYSEAAKWGRLPNGATDVRTIADGWLALYRTQRAYPGVQGQVARPASC